ncbi:ThiF family adenylyltransferase [Candidatus Woesearchaeota archaeon]|nr:ThiF family adenylyltransferase [Candidatus Woesearchaeota archaeon]
MNDFTRYDRQKLIEGWDQKRLSEGTATIIGSGAIARYTALSLAALGVGNIRILDTEQGNAMLLDLPIQGNMAENTARAIRIINPGINVTAINTNLTTRTAQYFLKDSTVIIETTNNITSKAHAAEYHYETKTPLISVGGGQNQGKIIAGETCEQLLLPMYKGQKQGDLIGLALGGMAAEEAKKAIMNSGNTLTRMYTYNLESRVRFSHVKDQQIMNENGEFRRARVLIVGAGALGCFLGPAMAKLGPENITVMDYDTVEEHNLNRQVCYYDAVGQLKAQRLAQTMRITSPSIEVTAITEKFTPETKLERYDLILDAVDSFYTKAMLHKYALENGIPIISGGTDPRAATVIVYVPEKTSCFDCQIHLSQLALKAEILRRTSCLQAPDPSVIMTNQIAAAFMTAEARTVLRPDIYGDPVNGELKYIADFDTRGGATIRNKPCNCRTTQSLELPIPSRVHIEETEEGDGKKRRRVYVDGREI